MAVQQAHKPPASQINEILMCKKFLNFCHQRKIEILLVMGSKPGQVQLIKHGLFM